ncbi:hypothetical protein NL108_018721 [Boleophthalmus pectinirostris]|nr:hypothetical protein NL108_018721 [Boleophthalmus pectinirostris]
MCRFLCDILSCRGKCSQKLKTDVAQSRALCPNVVFAAMNQTEGGPAHGDHGDFTPMSRSAGPVRRGDTWCKSTTIFMHSSHAPKYVDKGSQAVTSPKRAKPLELQCTPFAHLLLAPVALRLFPLWAQAALLLSLHTGGSG